MIASCLSLLFNLLIAASEAQSVASSNFSFANTTSPSPSTITPSPSLNATSLSLINTSCSSCAFAADLNGLEKIFWFSQTWSVTLDTEHVTVTSFNGSNLTAVTSTRTVLGNVSALNTDVPYVQSLMRTLSNGPNYYNPQPTLVRGTDGSVGTTSYSYGQAFAQVTAIKYLSMNPNAFCHTSMDGKSGCQCSLNTWYPFFEFNPVTQISSSEYTMDQTFYTPLASSIINQNNVGSLDDEIGELRPWDGKHFMSWLGRDEAFSSAFPHWQDCAVWDTAAGPPAVKLPVAALTGTTSTTVYQAAPVTSSTPKPASRSSSPLPKSTTFTDTTSSKAPVASSISGNTGQSGGVTGDSSGSDSSGNESSGSQGDTGSTSSSDTSGSSGDQGNNGNSGNSGVGGDTASDTGSTGSGSSQQGGSESGANTGATYTSASRASDRPSVATAPNGQSGASSGSKGDSGSSGDSGSQSDSGSSVSENGSGSQEDGGGQGTIDSSSSSNSGSGGESTETNDLPSAAPFIVTVSDHTVSGTILGSTAAVIAGTTIVAGSSPSSAGGVLVSVHPGASSIYVNGESHPLPTPQPFHASAIPIATIGSHILSATPGASAVSYAGTTLSQGGAHAIIDGTDVYVGASGLVIGGHSAVALPTLSSPHNSATPIATIGSHTISAIPGASEVYFAGVTLSQSGAHATIDNTDIYVGGSGLVIGSSSTVALPPLDSPHFSATPIATIGTQVLSAIPGDSEEVYYAGVTLTQNGAHATIDNTDIYLSGSDLIIGDSSTVALPTADSPKFYATPIATVGTQVLSAIPGDSEEVYYAGVTLTQNGAHVTIDNTDVYVGSSGLVVGGSSTVAIPTLSPISITGSTPDATKVQTFTLGGQILSADNTALYVGGSTLAVGGPAVTISGTPISLGSSDIVIASTTYTIPSSALPSGTLPGATETSDGLGAIIYGAFGPHTGSASAIGTSAVSSNTSSAVAFQGAAARPDQREFTGLLGSLVVGGLFWFVNGLF